jgi:tight adherence protein B
MNRQELLNTILMYAVFVLVFSAWSMCVVLWVVQYIRRQQQVRQRLGVGGLEVQRSQALQLWRAQREGRRRLSRTRKETWSERLERLRLDAGWKGSASLVLLGVAAVAGLASATMYVLGFGVWLTVGVAVAILAVFWVVTKKRIAAHVALFERQFVDSLGIAARALRAGHPLVGAFQLVATEVGDPIGRIFGEVCQEQALGLDLESSIRRVADTSHNADLKLFATAVRIQLNSGGNLAELMDTLANVMRSRIRLHRRVRVLTAQTNMSKRILMGLPILLFVILNIIAPAYMALFYADWSGRCLLAGTVASVLLGAWLMEKLSVIRY